MSEKVNEIQVIEITEELLGEKLYEVSGIFNIIFLTILIRVFMM